MKYDAILIFYFIRVGGLENLLLNTARVLLKNNLKIGILALYSDKKLVEEMGIPKELLILPPKYLEKYLERKSIRYFFGIPLIFYLIFNNYKKTKILMPFAPLIMHFCSLIKIFNPTLKIIYYECDVKLEKSVFHKFKSLSQKIATVFNETVQNILDDYLIKFVDKMIVIDENNLYLAKKHYGKFLKEICLAYPMTEVKVKSKNISEIREKILKFFQNNDNKALCTVGTLDWKKNQIKSIELLEYLRENKLNYSLLIAGVGEDEIKIKERIKISKYKDNIFMTGKINNQELEFIYNKIYANVFLAQNQTWGLTPFEALKFNKFSVVSKSSGCSAFIKKYNLGKVIDLEDIKWKEDAKKFLEDGIKKLKIDNNYLKEISEEKYAEKILKLIESI